MTRMHICVGAGGVGKTTAAAALALALARRGERVCVVTIDPARRLAAALGLRELGDRPRQIAVAGLEGELWAMMLDPKRTFDELIGRLAGDESERDAVLGNRIYRELSTAVAGSQEFTAVAKLYELDRDGGFDAIVLDTPPARNARDFLSAPGRLRQFFEGRALRTLLAPGRLMGRGSSVVFGVLRRVTGVDLLADLSAFFGALAGMIEGFRERTLAVEALLRRPSTGFVVVSSPEHEPMREALEFAAELAAENMQVSCAIINRVRRVGAPPPAGELEQLLGTRLGGALARLAAEEAELAERDHLAIGRLAEATGLKPLAVPELAGDVHDIAGLAAVADQLGDFPGLR